MNELLKGSRNKVVENITKYRFQDMHEAMQCFNARYANPDTQDPGLLALRAATTSVKFDLSNLTVTGPQFEIEILVGYNDSNSKKTLYTQ